MIIIIIIIIIIVTTTTTTTTTTATKYLIYRFLAAYTALISDFCFLIFIVLWCSALSN